MKTGLYKGHLFAGIFLIMLVFSGFAQPCLTGWTYRSEVLVDNSAGTTLTDFQVNLILNTQSLIVNGKARIDGADLRFLNSSGNVLPFWIENDTYNSTSTSIWIKVNEITAGAVDTIYLFYGEPGATSLSDGSATFELFDDFSGGSIDATKWSSCNGGTIAVAGGTATFTSGALTTEKAAIRAVNSISTPVISEMDVTSVSGGIAIIGTQTSSDEGYGLAFEDNGLPTMRMIGFQAGSACTENFNVPPPNNDAKSANTVTGTWGFCWPENGNQYFSWPGQINDETRVDANVALPIAVEPIIGSMNKAGSLSVDWMRVRKYTAVEPTLSLGIEVASVFSATASNNSTLCEGEELELNTPFVSGATYNWTGPNGFVSTDQNPTISDITTVNSGDYQVTVSIPDGCSSASATTSVTIDPTTVPGTLSGTDVVCQGENSGTVQVIGYVGGTVRWESTLTGGTPWTTIAEENDTLTYDDLLSTTTYRAVIQSGVCEEALTNEIIVQVDTQTESGHVLGETDHCSVLNSGSLKLVNHVGSVQRWQSQVLGSGVWSETFVSDTVFSYSNLDTSMYYRVSSKNGVCEEEFSDSVLITIHPLPIVGFTAIDTCLAIATQFTNTTIVNTGQVAHWIWDFNDGSGSIVKNPNHIFSDPGQHSVKLIAITDEDCSDSITVQLNVDFLPTVDFQYDDVCDRNAMSFVALASIDQGSIAALNWDFGNSVNSVDANPSLTYNEDGDYEVQLVATSNEGCTDSISQTVTVFPRADLDFSVDTVFLGETSLFVNSSMINSGTLAYEWRFGDGQTSTDINPSNTYQSAQVFDVVLISTSDKGCLDTLEGKAVVNSDAKASFTVEDVCRYDSAMFVNTSFIANGTLTYFWDFGDGDTSRLTDPAHIYGEDGTYLVKLTATSDLGSVSEASGFVKIKTIPQASFVTADACDLVPVSFSNLSTISSGTMTYDWSFGEGNLSTEFQPSHTYADATDYIVRLIVTSDFGCQDTAFQDVTVYPRPETNFGALAVCDGTVSTFLDSTEIASGEIVSWQWSFGDGSNSIEQNPEKLFAGPGTYQVTLKTVSDQNCDHTTSKDIQVVSVPVANYSFDDECHLVAVQFVNTSFNDEGDLNYTWTFGDGDTSSLQAPSHTYPAAGTYDVSLIAYSDFGCADTLDNEVVVFALPQPNAGVDTTVSRGFSVQLEATGGDDFIWQPADGLTSQSVYDPIATPLVTTTYTVSVVDSNGCTGADKMILTVEDDFILSATNVITPDGNNKNDTWVVRNIEAYGEAYVQVFDRWGKRVFETRDYQNDWGGVSGTDILPDGEYYYVITFDSSDVIYKGTITLIRNR